MPEPHRVPWKLLALAALAGVLLGGGAWWLHGMRSGTDTVDHGIALPPTPAPKHPAVAPR